LPADAKDIAIAALNGSVALAGLLLIFSGFLFSQAATFDQATVDEATIDRYRIAAKAGVLPFVLCLGIAAAATLWLHHQQEWLFAAIEWGFLALLALTAAYGAFVILKYL
jgi:hypothetical protein